MKRVLIVTDCMFPIPAVCGGAVSTLIESLAKINEKEKKCKLYIYTIKNQASVKSESTYPSSTFIQFKTNKYVEIADKIFFKKKQLLKKLSVIVQVRKLLKKNDFDYIVLQNFGYLLKIFRDKHLLNSYSGKVYYHLHNDIPYNVDISIVKHCKLLLISKYLENRIIELCGDNMIRQCYIIKNGINVSDFRRQLSEQEKDIIKKRYGIKEGEKTILFVGRLDKSKGLSELLAALQKLDETFKLIIVGSTLFGKKYVSDFEKDIRESCKKLGSRVVFTGFVHHTEIWKYYKIADMAVLPSIWEEPAGLTMIEASVSGIPLITTISGGIPEYIRNDSAIMISKEGDIIQNLVYAIMNIATDLQVAKKRAESFSDYYSTLFSEEAFYFRFINALN